MRKIIVGAQVSIALSTALQKMDIHNKLLFLDGLCKSLVIRKNRAIMHPSMR